MKLESTGLIVIDYQGKLARVMHETAQLHANMVRLIKGVQLFDMPILWVEQYPKGLGATVDGIKELLEVDNQPITKMNFSGCKESEFQAMLNKVDKDNYLVAGIEAHICVYQTIRELLDLGKHVEYVQDAISSRTIENKQMAFNKMNLMGAFPTSVEMALFELMGTAEHSKFKEISGLIK